MSKIPVNFYPKFFPALNVAELDVIEGTAGPGKRMVIWLQGCLKRCPGCANGSFLSESRRHLLSVEQLCTLLDAAGDLAGITLSGGEPLIQAAALVPLLQEVRRRNLNVVCYSGYTLEELTAGDSDPVVAKFLELVDLLIDGEYRSDLPRAGAYRPSSNQRLHFLSGRIPPTEHEQVVETVFNFSRRQVTATGTLPLAVRLQIFQKLREAGIDLKTRA